MSTDTGTIVAFYHAHTWGGEIEVEYSWVFGPEERRYEFEGQRRVIAQTWTEVREIADGGVLRLTLAHFGLELPTAYCALMTRGFDWGRFRLAHG